MLQKLNIYHSDTKLENFVYSKSKKKFLLIDFGGSRKTKIEPKYKSSLVNIEDYGSTGTKGYLSPEKKTYWEWFDKNNDNEEKFDRNFDPFKCDMWSLGVCIEKMLGIDSGDISDKSKGKGFLIDIITMLKEKDFQKRSNALELHGFVKKINLNEYTDNSGIMQKEFDLIVELNKEKYERKLMSGRKNRKEKNYFALYFFFLKRLQREARS